MTTETITTENGVPVIPFVEMAFPQDWASRLDRSIEAANEFLFDLLSEGLPPKIERRGNTIYFPRFLTYGDTMIRTMLTTTPVEAPLFFYFVFSLKEEFPEFDADSVIADVMGQVRQDRPPPATNRRAKSE